MHKQDKSNNTGLRILEVLKILRENEVTKHELIDKLKNISNIENVYTQEAFIKYFNTLEAIGIHVEKEGRVYKISNSFENINLSSEEQSIVLKLLKYANKLYNIKEEQAIYNVFKKAQKNININTKQIIDNIIKENNAFYNENIKNNIINTIINYINDEQLVSITLKKNNSPNETVIVEIKNVTEKNNKIYITCYNSSWAKNRKICIDSVIEMKQLSKKSPNVYIKNSTVFEIYGRLIKSYRIRPNEKVLELNGEKLTISNEGEDFDSILLRLLKYGENCKVIKPLFLQKQLIDLTENMLKNLETEV